jgi:hypothetical protein
MPDPSVPPSIALTNLVVESPASWIERALPMLVRAARRISGTVLSDELEPYPGDLGCMFYVRDPDRHLALVVFLSELAPNVSRISVAGVGAYETVAEALVEAVQREYGPLAHVEESEAGRPRLEESERWEWITEKVREYEALLAGGLTRGAAARKVKDADGHPIPRSTLERWRQRISAEH